MAKREDTKTNYNIPAQTVEATPQSNQEQIQPISDLIHFRVRADQLEQELSDAIHLLYGIIAWNLIDASPDTRSKIARSVHLKLLQFPQGCPIGRRLIELDEQFGGLLETKGIWLKRWVYEPREKANG